MNVAETDEPRPGLILDYHEADLTLSLGRERRCPFLNGHRGPCAHYSKYRKLGSAPPVSLWYDYGGEAEDGPWHFTGP
jgi:hypothetical protein